MMIYSSRRQPAKTYIVSNTGLAELVAAINRTRLETRHRPRSVTTGLRLGILRQPRFGICSEQISSAAPGSFFMNQAFTDILNGAGLPLGPRNASIPWRKIGHHQT